MRIAWLILLATWSLTASGIDKVRLQNEAVVQAAVKGIKENLPQKVDPYTTMVDVQGRGTTLVYIFKVDAGPKSDTQLIEEGKDRMTRNVTRGTCRNAVRFLKSGITLVHRYLSAHTGKKLFDVVVRPKDCPALQE